MAATLPMRVLLVTILAGLAHCAPAAVRVPTLAVTVPAGQPDALLRAIEARRRNRASASASAIASGDGVVRAGAEQDVIRLAPGGCMLAGEWCP